MKCTSRRPIGIAFIVLVTAFLFRGAEVSGANRPLPDPAADDPLASSRGQQTAVLAGGCFWGIEAVFDHLKGVIDATSGYSGGSAKTASYEMVSSDTTGHAESVKVSYDPSQISFGQLLKIFFSVGHDPTEVNRQGPDVGTQYRSVIFYSNGNQQRIAQAYIEQLEGAKIFPHRIATAVVPLEAFYPAEAYHQDYAARHPYDPYIMFNDRPKVDALRKQYPGLYVERERR